MDRLRNLADSMLGSRQLPSYEMVNVHEPLERVRSLIVNQTKKKIKITRDYDLSLPEVLADRDQLIQVMLNICVNAVQAMTENKDFFVEHQPELILRTRIQRLYTISGVIHRSVVRIDIEDNGPGVPDDIIEAVFYPLVTSRAKGTGLGLSIAQNIMHQHNGMIECQSVPGKPYLAYFYLGSQIMSRNKIWVIDDDRAMRWVLEKHLKKKVSTLLVLKKPSQHLISWA